MKFRMVAIGRHMPAPIQTLVTEYSTRLRYYGGVEMVEVPPAPKRNDPAADDRYALTWEKERLLACLNSSDEKGAAIVPLDVAGKLYSSEAFSTFLDQHRQIGCRVLTFVIGGPDGLDPFILQNFSHPLSLGPMTFPHLLTRVLLLEQIYRAMTILHGHPYHR